MRLFARISTIFLLTTALTIPLAQAQDLAALKTELQANIDGKAKLTQEIVDSLFSFSERGFQG